MFRQLRQLKDEIAQIGQPNVSMQHLSMGMTGDFEVAIEEGATRQSAMEITVKFDDGRLIAVTQAGDEKFRPGDRVRVLTGSGVTRISH